MPPAPGACGFRSGHGSAIIETVLPAEAAKARYGGSALFDGDKITIGTAAAKAATIIGTPTIGISSPRSPNKNSEAHDQGRRKHNPHDAPPKLKRFPLRGPRRLFYTSIDE